MIYVDIFVLAVLAFVALLVVYEMLQGKSNCLFWAVPKWIQRGVAGEEPYICFRWCRVPYGIFHCLLGDWDPTRYRIRMTSYKPIGNQNKTGFEPVFHGHVVEGDEETDHGDLS